MSGPSLSNRWLASLNSKQDLFCVPICVVASSFCVPAQASEKQNDVAHLSVKELQALLAKAALGNPDKVHQLMRNAQLNDEFAALMDWAATQAETPVWKAVQAYARKYDKSLYRVLLEKSDVAHAATLQVVEGSRKVIGLLIDPPHQHHVGSRDLDNGVCLAGCLGRRTRAATDASA